MAHEIKTIKNYTIHYFDYFEEAQDWLRANYGEDAQFVSYLSRKDITTWATIIDTKFDGKQYPINNLVEIIRNRDAATLKRINPLFFQYMRVAMTEEDMKFWAETMTIQQLQHIPNIVLGFFNTECLEIMQNTASENKRLHHYKLYTIPKTLTNNELIYVQVKQFTLTEALRRKIQYSNRYGKHHIDKKTPEKINFKSTYVTIEQVASYLSLNVQYFSVVKNGRIAHYLGTEELVDGKRVFRTKNLIRLMHDTYEPIDSTHKDDPAYYLPEDGVYSRDELPGMFRVEKSISNRSLGHAISNHKISFFSTTERFNRISKKDFQEFVVARFEGDHSMDFVENKVNRQVVQFPKRATQEQIAEVMTHYTLEEDFMDALLFSENMPWGKLKNKYQSSLYKSLSEMSQPYLNRMDGKQYRKNSEIDTWFRKAYVDENGRNLKSKAAKFNFNDFVKAKKEDPDHFGDLCIVSRIDEWVKLKYPEANAAKIRKDLPRWIREGDLPSFVFSRSYKFVYIPDLLKVERFQNLVQKKK